MANTEGSQKKNIGEEKKPKKKKQSNRITDTEQKDVEVLGGKKEGGTKTSQSMADGEGPG